MQTIPQNQVTNATREQARELYLKRKRAEVIEQTKGADNNERKAVIRNIDAFLKSATPDGRIFWLKVRRDIEKQIEKGEVRDEKS